MQSRPTCAERRRSRGSIETSAHVSLRVLGGPVSLARKQSRLCSLRALHGAGLSSIRTSGPTWLARQRNATLTVVRALMSRLFPHTDIEVDTVQRRRLEYEKENRGYAEEGLGGLLMRIEGRPGDVDETSMTRLVRSLASLRAFVEVCRETALIAVSVLGAVGVSSWRTNWSHARRGTTRLREHHQLDTYASASSRSLSSRNAIYCSVSYLVSCIIHSP